MSPAIAASLSLIAALAADAPRPASAPDPAALARVRTLEQARVELIQRLTDSVVCIFPQGNRAGGGSGVIIDSQGFGLTNFHVVRPFAASRRGDGGLADGKLYPLHLLGVDPTGDVAMFRLDAPRPLQPAPLGDSDSLQVGDWTLALGNPFLLAEDFRPTVTCGVVSGLHRYQRGEGRALVYTDCIQVDTSINPGNSGGPLFDLRGDLVGINGRISIGEAGRVNVGVGYAITINQIRRFIPALRAGLTVQHGSAGFTTRTRATGETLVDQIIADSPAHRAGVRAGDRVVRFNGVAVRSDNHFLTLLGTFPANWPVELETQRDGRTATARFRLDAVPLPKELVPPPEVRERLHLNDPFRPNPEANARATRRALDRFRRFVGGDDAIAALKSVRCVGARRRAAAAEPVAIDLTERPVAPDAAPPDAPGELERWARWCLLHAVADPPQAGYAVVGADSVAGRIAVRIDRTLPGLAPLKFSFDDEDGALLALEFESPQSHQHLRYEYSQPLRSGAIRWFARRTLSVGDRPLFEDEWTRVEPRANAD